ncbi:transcriptional regulator, TetR family [Variovorax sp. 770b2]|jgi:AcrR family transcriptional regulator|nr:transcriptional regulator, TetR family [Variovorax sp. 770b2]
MDGRDETRCAHVKMHTFRSSQAMVGMNPSKPVSPAPSVRKRPQQERGVVRFNRLLDAAHALLERQELHEIGLYQIAKEAQVPPASAYHFFPSPDAVLLALAERYHTLFYELVDHVDAPRAPTWQAWLKLRIAAAVRLYNDTPPIRKLLLGSHTTREVVQSEAGFNDVLARSILAHCERLFHMPYVRDAERRFLVMLTLIDAVLSLSYAKHGMITPQFEEDALVAAVSYCRTFLPEVIEQREAVAPSKTES